ncbi:MAG: Grx4 family monothiol glutaredoxin [Gammaproteobacteria bacterium]
MLEPIELSLFASRLQAICEEMGTALRRTAFSPNIRDRLDFSCAVFDTKGRLSAQAAHIPVHLGSMAFAMSGIVEGLRPAPGDMVILNDPYLGGTHLPDVTLIAPLFHGTEHCGFVVNRAHHADIGCATPGGMPIATRLEDEGLVIAPQRLMAEGRPLTEVMEWLIQATRDRTTARGDLAAQLGANRCGLGRLGALVASLGPKRYRASLVDLNDYGEGMARTALARIPAGCYRFTDWLDDDGQGQEDIPIRLALTVSGERVHADFAGTAAEVPGNLNCPLSVAAAAVYYVFYCLMPRETPACAGAFRPITLSAPEGCLLNARRPAAVAAGNVETSTRIVDVVLGALAQALPESIPAASHGSMNNLAMGASAMGTDTWDYYETVGGGMGAHARGPGLDGVQTHMTNTRNTPIEVLETSYPLRVTRYVLREASGGRGRHAGGRGLTREFQFLTPTSVTVLGERRRHAPWGLAGGGDGQRAVTLLNGTPLPGKVHLTAAPGDRLTLESAGGGGWGDVCSDPRNDYTGPVESPSSERSTMDAMEQIKQTIEGNPVVIFMKGTPDFPQCGFSMRTTEALRACHVDFAHVDVLAEPEVRQNLPRYSNWPTFPQVFINGELVGGCDIVLDLYQSGELQKMTQAAAGHTAA